jgi:hypothetical protein
VDLKPNLGVAHNNLAATFAMMEDFESAAYHVQIAQALGYAVHPGFVSQLRAELLKRKNESQSR